MTDGGGNTERESLSAPERSVPVEVEYELYVLRIFAGEAVTERVFTFLEQRGLEPHLVQHNLSDFEKGLKS